MWAGLLMGFISSFHCVGMCGPLALALPIHHLSRAQQITAITLYHAGRVLTYSIFGALFGLAGRGLYVAGLQQWFSIALGILMLLMSFLNISTRHTKMPQVQALIIKLLRSRRYYNFLLLGMANGLLPCGMVYFAIAGAIATSSMLQGSLFMACFGIGTLPAMMALSIFGMRIKLSHRKHINKILPYVTVCIAILFILRGLNLGIPFVSPLLPQAPQQAIICH